MHSTDGRMCNNPIQKKPFFKMKNDSKNTSILSKLWFIA